MPADYSTLARAVSGFTDQLEVEANQVKEQKRAANTIMRQLFPDISEGEAHARLKQFDVRGEELARTCVRLRRLLHDVASSGSNPLPPEEGAHVQEMAEALLDLVKYGATHALCTAYAFADPVNGVFRITAQDGSVYSVRVTRE